MVVHSLLFMCIPPPPLFALKGKSKSEYQTSTSSRLGVCRAKRYTRNIERLNTMVQSEDIVSFVHPISRYRV